MNEISVDFAALVLVQIAFEKNLIDKKTYEEVMRKYGGTFYDNEIHE